MPKKLNSHQIRKSDPKKAKEIQKQIERHPLVLVLDNVLDTYNIGTFFRLADALALKKIYLCGQVVTPPNIKIHRSSVGTWKWIPWEHCPSTVNCLKKLKKDGYQIVAIEQTNNSKSYLESNYKFPVALVLGSESQGISSEVLKLAHQTVELPMFGINKSLNVLVAASVISYHILTKSR
jgi:tRNA G18 (ribose-2'-O)-methylase SpoU